VLARDTTCVSTDGRVPGLGAYPAGDPEAIRAAAADLRRIAARLAAAPRPTIDGWSSEAAQRMRSMLTSAADTADRTGADVRSLAAALDHAADVLETDQRAWKAAKLRIEEGAAR
jgi:hypothetical protein